MLWGCFIAHRCFFPNINTYSVVLTFKRIILITAHILYDISVLQWFLFESASVTLREPAWCIFNC